MKTFQVLHSRRTMREAGCELHPQHPVVLRGCLQKTFVPVLHLKDLEGLQHSQLATERPRTAPPLPRYLCLLEQ